MYTDIYRYIPQSGLLAAAVEAVLAALEALSEEAARNPALTGIYIDVYRYLPIYGDL
jgi:hypothetical protein